MFANHGTKIIGAVSTVIGVAATLTPEQLTALFGPQAPSVAMTVMGILTIMRGFQNSGTLPGGPKA